MQVAFLSVDVKGSTLLKVDSEPERIKHTFDAYHEFTETLIEKNRGLIISSLGDGLLGQFLNVDDAVAAGVEIQAGIGDFNRDRNQLLFPFLLRVGVSYGAIAVERVTGRDAELIIDLAVKVQEHGEPGSVCITLDAFQNLERYRDYFSYRDYVESLKSEIYVNRPLSTWNAYSLGAATASYNQGFDLLEQDRFAEAEAAFRRALAEAEATRELPQVSACIHGLAYALGRQRKNREKIPFCLRQIRIEQKLGRARELQTALRNIYFAYFWLARDLEREARFKEALTCYTKARVLAEKLGDRRLSKESGRNLNDLRSYLKAKTE